MRSLARFYAGSLTVSCQHGRVFYPRSFTWEPAETRLSCQGAMGMLAHSRTHDNKTRGKACGRFIPPHEWQGLICTIFCNQFAVCFHRYNGLYQCSNYIVPLSGCPFVLFTASL